MRLSVWLLKYLPRFTHICPKCRKEVKANSHECPYCGEKYPLTLKIPPRFLKDKKKLEAYVHEHVFPRISAWERHYLEQFFTVFFSNSFETGDFSEWASTYGTLSIITSPVYSGSYAASISGSLSYAIQNLTPMTSAYMRCYVYLPALPLAGSLQSLTGLDSSSAGYQGILCCIGNNSGSMYWALYDYTNSVSYPQTATININTWYCVEFQTVMGSSGGGTLWINGVQTITFSANLISTTLNSAAIIADTFSGTPFTVYYDDIVVADTYIGPLQTNINVSDSGLGSDVVAVTASMTVTETGSGSDAIASLQANIPISDAGLGSDALSSLKAQIPVSDASLGADSVGVQGTIPVSDVSSGADSIASLQAQVPIADSSSGLDNATVQGQIPVSDSGLGSDAVSLKNQIPVADLGLSSDVLSLIAQVPITDSGAGSDNAVVGSPVNVSDSGAGSDALSSINAQVPLADSGLGTDSLVLGSPVNLSDSGLSSDVVAIQAQILINDVGAGLDSAIVNVSIILSDVGLGSDALAVTVPISLLDTGLGIDTVITFIQQPPRTHAVIIIGEKGNVTLQTEKGNVTLQSDSD